MQTQTQCYFCAQTISGPTEHHHPDKNRFPNWTEPAHPQCHTRYHSESNHFKQWGSQSPFAGRPGYERVIARYPAFHSMGGKARARSAHRDARGRFLADHPTPYGSDAWQQRTQKQTEKMTAGPHLDDDGFTLIVPSEWYSEDAHQFWLSKKFEWRPKTSTWERDTRRPLGEQTYTPQAWLAATRRKYYQLWPHLRQPRRPHRQTDPAQHQAQADRQRYIEGEYSQYIEH